MVVFNLFCVIWKALHLSCVNQNAFHLFCVKQQGILVHSDPSQSVAVLVKWVY